MYYLQTKASFDAAHFLWKYEGKCRNIHGHRWNVVAKIKSQELEREGQTRGMVVDFSNLKNDLKVLCDYFDNPENDYFVKFNCPEFTSLCPITGQPDFATITISYVPDERLVESKSLKLYLFSFRNHGDFHEDVINIIMKDLVKLLEPKYIEVWGKFLPRGGLSIDPYCNYGKPGTEWEQVAWNRMSNHDMFPERVDNR